MSCGNNTGTGNAQSAYAVIAEFSNPQYPAGTTPYDPTSVHADVTDPNGSTTQYEYLVDPALERLEEGVYRITFDLPTAGSYLVDFYGSGDAYLGPRDQFKVVAC